MGSGSENYTTTAGFVNDPAVQRVVVVFGDGTREVVLVEHASYFVVKEGPASMARIDALDARGTVLHTVP